MKRKGLLQFNILAKVKVAVVLLVAETLMLFGGLTACGDTAEEVPELMEPTSLAESYRTVTKRIVGSVKYHKATVVPTEYPVFSEKPLPILQINVGVGDYVEEGQVLVSGGTSDNNDQISELQNSIASLQRLRAKQENVSNETINILGYERLIEEYLQDADGINEKNKNVLIEEENKRYELADIDNKISEQRALLTKLQNEVSSCTLTAPCSGRVCFVKDMTKSNMASPYENIITIIDENDLYIECEDITLDNYQYNDYKSKWAYINGKQVNLVEKKYTTDEVAYATSVKKNPRMGFEVPGEKLTMGVDVILCFLEEKNTPKIVVGNDSINYGTDEDYIYVKNENGEKEKRIVELGETDGLYTEVKSGLKEGEKVFYENTALVPEKYEVEVASIGDYSEEQSTKTVNFAYPYYDIYVAEVNGTYRKLRDIGDASEGDALFSIESSVGKGEIDEISDDIDDLDAARKEAIKAYEDGKNGINEALAYADPDYGTDTDAIRENMYLSERLDCQSNILDYEEDYSSKDYTANRGYLSSVLQKMRKGTTVMDGRSDYTQYSTGPGRIEFVAFNEDSVIEKNSFIMAEGIRKEEENTRLFAVMGSLSAIPPISATVGRTVTLKQGSKTTTGTCIGKNGISDRYMLFTRNGKPCVTYSAPFSKNAEFQFYVEMDSKIEEKDLTKCEITFNGVDVKGAVVISASALRSEQSQLNDEFKYYVWKLEGDQIVKEYVDVYHPQAATSTKLILNGVEPGDKVLK